MKKLFFIAISALMLCCCAGSSDDSPKPVPPVPPTPERPFLTGADISWYTEMVAKGYSFKNQTGVQMTCPELMKDYGMDIIRLRVWVNPADGWCGKDDVLSKAQAVKAAGMDVMIDFHFGDSWCDPGKQPVPSAWKGHSVEELKTDIDAHVKDVLNALKAKGITPAFVQIGNETDDGFLWETARASTNPANYATLLQAGYDAVKAVCPSTKVIIHISNAPKLDVYTWQIKDIFQKYNVSYDVIGMSLYPSYQTEGVTVCIDKYINNVKTIYAAYKKECMLVEVGLPVEAKSSAAYMKDILEKSKNNTDGHCLGVLYWEPESWNGWGGYGLGASTANGNVVTPNTILNVFKAY